MFCCTLLYVFSRFAIILTGKRELVALLNLSSWCLVMVERLFLAVPRGCLRFLIVFPDHTHLAIFGVRKFTILCRGFLNCAWRRVSLRMIVTDIFIWSKIRSHGRQTF